MFRTVLRMNLQKFAEPLEDDNESVLVDDENDLDTPTEDEPTEGPTEDEPTEDEPNEEPKPKQDPDIEPDWIKKRLARAERSYERKFLEEVASESDGVQLERRELPKAAKLWNLLKHNPEISKQVDALLIQSGEEGKLKPLTQVRPDAKINRMEAEFDLREAELELKYSDPVYKKYSEKIKDWAEDEGLDVSNPRTLKLAVKAWKADNAALLLANKPKSKTQPDPKRKSAKLAGGQSPQKGTPIDYRKAADKDILKSMGLSLFSDE